MLKYYAWFVFISLVKVITFKGLLSYNTVLTKKLKLAKSRECWNQNLKKENSQTHLHMLGSHPKTRNLCSLNKTKPILGWLAFMKSQLLSDSSL